MTAPLAPERTLTPYDEAVLEAAALLDERGPTGWRELVDLESLNLVDCHHCMLAQIYGGFTQGLRDLGMDYSSHRVRAFSGSRAHEMQVAWRDYLTS